MLDPVDPVTREYGETRRPIRDGMRDLAREIDAHPACTVMDIQGAIRTKKIASPLSPITATASGIRTIFVSVTPPGAPDTVHNATIQDFGEWETLKRMLAMKPPVRAKSGRIKANKGGLSVQAIRTGDFIEVRKFDRKRQLHMEYWFNLRHWPPMPVDQHTLIAEYERDMTWRVFREKWEPAHDYLSVVDAVVRAVNGVMGLDRTPGRGVAMESGSEARN